MFIYLGGGSPPHSPTNLPLSVGQAQVSSISWTRDAVVGIDLGIGETNNFSLSLIPITAQALRCNSLRGLAFCWCTSLWDLCIRVSGIQESHIQANHAALSKTVCRRIVIHSVLVPIKYIFSEQALTLTKFTVQFNNLLDSPFFKFLHISLFLHLTNHTSNAPSLPIWLLKPSKINEPKTPNLRRPSVHGNQDPQGARVLPAFITVQLRCLMIFSMLVPEIHPWKS